MPLSTVQLARNKKEEIMSDEQHSNRKAVYTIVEGSGDKKRWIRVGIAFTNRDGSQNVLLDALPVNGQLHIRDFPPREGDEDAAVAPISPAAATTSAPKTSRKDRAAA